MPLPEPIDCPYYLISRATLVATAALKRALADAGVGQIRPAYLGVLMSLWKKDGLKMVDLGRRAGLEPSTMTGLLDRMERDDLVVRVPDPDDRRAYRIQLTELGRHVEEPVHRVVEYHPTLPEVAICIGVYCLGFLILTVLYKIVTAVREELDPV